jgi:ATP-binding cassette subfamily F protein 3
MLRRPNLLILDEPTNHLDLEGREALMQALVAYPGTVLFVSHDRNFVSSVGTRVLALSPDGLEDFAGGYEEYLRKHGEDYLSLDGARGRRPEAQPVAAPVAAGESYEARKEQRRNLAQLKRTVAKLEAEIAASEAELQTLEAAFADSGYYQRTGREQVERDAARRDALQAALSASMQAWEDAAAELEAIG